jgi:hypothetical protein
MAAASTTNYQLLIGRLPYPTGETDPVQEPVTAMREYHLFGRSYVACCLMPGDWLTDALTPLSLRARRPIGVEIIPLTCRASHNPAGFEGAW